MDDFAQLIRTLTDDQIKAKLPEQAARFFTEHPPLLAAWRVKFDNPAKARELEHNYFTTLPPDVQYGIVYDISEVHRAVGSLQAAFAVVNNVKVATTVDEVERFGRHGVNVHLSSKHYYGLLRALADQISAGRVMSQTLNNEVATLAILKNINDIKATFDHLNNELGKCYPELAASIKGV